MFFEQSKLGMFDIYIRKTSFFIVAFMTIMGLFLSGHSLLAQERSKKPQQVAKKQEQPKSKTKKFDDWYYRCIEKITDKKAPPRQCEVLQVAQVKSPTKDKATNATGENVSVLTLAFSKGLPNKKSKKRAILLTVLTPLNIHLPSGFELAVDKNKPIKNVYRNCNQAGCWVNAQLSDRDMQRLKKGKFGFGQMRLLNGQNVRIKFSLKGLELALAALEKEQKIN